MFTVKLIYCPVIMSLNCDADTTVVRGLECKTAKLGVL